MNYEELIEGFAERYEKYGKKIYISTNGTASGPFSASFSTLAAEGLPGTQGLNLADPQTFKIRLLSADFGTLPAENSQVNVSGSASVKYSIEKIKQLPGHPTFTLLVRKQ